MTRRTANILAYSLRSTVYGLLHPFFDNTPKLSAISRQPSARKKGAARTHRAAVSATGTPYARTADPRTGGQKFQKSRALSARRAPAIVASNARCPPRRDGLLELKTRSRPALKKAPRRQAPSKAPSPTGVGDDKQL
jgi:hypothetical protein